MNLFLESLTSVSGMPALGSLLAIFAAWMFLAIIVIVGIYIYMSFAYMSIAKKNKQTSPGLAWIPGVGPLIVAYKSSRMHWWPWLLLIGLVIPVVGFVALIVFAVFDVVWHWKLFEAIKKPGWWAVFMVIPLLNIVFLIFVGIAAWSD